MPRLYRHFNSRGSVEKVDVRALAALAAHVSDIRNQLIS